VKKGKQLSVLHLVQVWCSNKMKGKYKENKSGLWNKLIGHFTVASCARNDKPHGYCSITCKKTMDIALYVFEQKTTTATTNETFVPA